MEPQTTIFKIDFKKKTLIATLYVNNFTDMAMIHYPLNKKRLPKPNTKDTKK